MKNFMVALLAIAFSLAVFGILPGCVSSGDETSVKVAMLFDSPVADDSFSHACLKGAEQAMAQFDVTFIFTEAADEAEAGVLLHKLADSRAFGLIIRIGGSQSVALLETAQQYPRQKFALVDGDIAGIANISSLLTRDNESSFLVGALAALVSQNNHIGFVGGRDQTSIHRFLAGYRAGACYIKPDCQVSVDYAGSWLNDGKSKLLAIQQILEGADVLYGPAGAGSLGVIEAAREQGLYAIGVDADQSPLAPQTVLGSAVKHANIPIFQTIRSVVEGKFEGGIQSSGLKEGAVEAVVNSNISIITPEMRKTLTDIQDKILSGQITVPES